MAPYTKPETVLRRSEELLSVNQPLSALNSISEIFSSKRFRQTPVSSLEPIMLRFIDLCVLLQKGRLAKEGLHMYKNVAQNTSVSSVEVVIQHFIKKSKQRLDEGLAKFEEIEGPETKGTEKNDTDSAEAKEAPCEKTLGANVEDLEATETPEGLLLSTVSEESGRDRTYREHVTPWLRGLWEAYRTALDILRNNARLEQVYQQIASEAFQFCLKHDRKTEFRRLSETLRSNLASSQKYTHQTHSINLSDPEVLQRHLDTRFLQLSTAVELELWQEAFRAAEDIRGLVVMSKKSPKASVMAGFYDKMTKVFGVGHNFLFHAAAYNKYYALQASAIADQAQAEKLASAVLVSALAVPVGGGITGEGPRRREGDESEAKGKLGRLAGLLGLSSAPTRAGLLRDALGRGTLRRASKDVQALYEILEVDFHPLSITSKIEPILTRLAEEPDTSRYVEPLKDVVLARLFQQLSQVYDSLKLARIIKLASFGSSVGEGKDADAAQTRARVEKFVMEACRRGELEITLDHASASVHFANNVFETEPPSPAAGSSVAAAMDSAALLQPSSATLLRTHLTRLATAVSISLDCISPSSSPLSQALVARTRAFTALATEAPKQRKALLKRKVTIEDRRRRAEEANLRREKEENAARAARLAQVAEEQAARAQRIKKEREMQQAREMADKIRAEEGKKVAMALAQQAGLKIDTGNLQNVDTSTIIQMGVEQIEKDKKDLAAKLKIVNKRLDHTERAMRREEIPLLDQDYVQQQARDKETHESAHRDLVAAAKTRHEVDLAIKGKLLRLLPDYKQYQAALAERRGIDFKAAEERAKKQIEVAKAERKAQILKQRREEREQKAEEERLEREREAAEEQRRAQEEREEEERRARQAELEEQARLAKEAAEAKTKAMREAREKERAEAAEAAARQLAREAEAEARRNRTTPSVLGSNTRRSGAAAGGGGGAEPVSGAARAPSGAATPPTSSTEFRRTNVPTKQAGSGGWRDRVVAGASPPSSRGQSPVLGEAPRRFVPPSGSAGWRDRELAKAAKTGSGAVTPTKDDEGRPELRKPLGSATGGGYKPPQRR